MCRRWRDSHLRLLRETVMLDIILKRRIELLTALPLTKLEPLAIQHEIQQIGSR